MGIICEWDNILSEFEFFVLSFFWFRQSNQSVLCTGRHSSGRLSSLVWYVSAVRPWRFISPPHWRVNPNAVDRRGNHVDVDKLELGDDVVRNAGAGVYNLHCADD